MRNAWQELDNVNKDLATLEGHIREVTAQIDPLKQARANAKRAHTVRHGTVHTLPYLLLEAQNRNTSCMY